MTSSNIDYMRRCDIQKMTELEKKITEIMYTIETMGADVRLTDVQSLLGAAKTRLADFEDDIFGIRTVPMQIKDV